MTEEPMSDDRLRVLGIAASNEVEDCLREIRCLRAMVGGLEEIRRADGEALKEITAYAHKLEKQRDDLQAVIKAEIGRRREAEIAHDLHCALPRPCIFDVNRERALRETPEPRKRVDKP